MRCAQPEARRWFRRDPIAALRPSNLQPLGVVARQLDHFDDMSADVVATQGPGCCDPMMAVENVILAAPCPHLDGREWLTLAHGDQYAAQTGASSVTDRPEFPVEQLRSAVNRPHDAGDRDELFAGLPKLPRPAGDVLQQRKRPASISAQHAEQLAARTASAATDQSRRRCPRGRTRCQPWSADQQRSARGGECLLLWRGFPSGRRETRSTPGPPPTLDRALSGVTRAQGFRTSSSRDRIFNVVRRGLIPPVTSGRVIAG